MADVWRLLKGRRAAARQEEASRHNLNKRTIHKYECGRIQTIASLFSLLAKDGPSTRWVAPALAPTISSKRCPGLFSIGAQAPNTNSYTSISAISTDVL